jgi:hypothetical protein
MSFTGDIIRGIKRLEVLEQFARYDVKKARIGTPRRCELCHAPITKNQEYRTAGGQHARIVHEECFQNE